MQKSPLTNGSFTSMKRPVILQIRDPKTKVYTHTTIFVEPGDPRTDLEIARDFKASRKAQIADKRNYNKAAKLANFNKTANWATGPVYPNPGISTLQEKPDTSVDQALLDFLGLNK